MKMFKNNKGFSLVELLITIALIGILVAISMPTILSQIYHQRLIRATRDLFSEINAARVNAIVKNVWYEVDVNGTSFQLKYNNNTGTGAWVNEPSHGPVTIQPKVNVTAPGATFQVVYRPNGTVAVAGDICLSNATKNGDTMGIVFTGSLGKVSIVSGC